MHFLSGCRYRDGSGDRRLASDGWRPSVWQPAGAGMLQRCRGWAPPRHPRPSACSSDTELASTAVAEVSSYELELAPVCSPVVQSLQFNSWAQFRGSTCIKHVRTSTSHELSALLWGSGIAELRGMSSWLWCGVSPAVHHSGSRLWSEAPRLRPQLCPRPWLATPLWPPLAAWALLSLSQCGWHADGLLKTFICQAL